MKNLFDTSALDAVAGEQTEALATSGGVRVERIVSFGASSPAGFWYDQAQDEWAAVIQGEAVLEYFDGSTVEMSAGDHLVIKAVVKHRVAFTSYDCIWLAVML